VDSWSSACAAGHELASFDASPPLLLPLEEPLLLPLLLPELLLLPLLLPELLLLAVPSFPASFPPLAGEDELEHPAAATAATNDTLPKARSKDPRFM